MKDLVKSALSGDRLSIARLISLVEREGDGAADAMREIHKHAGNAYVIGVTGVAGGGKSTLISGLAREFRKQGKRIGIIAIDPTSPFSGGALLGDRVRMNDISGDDGVFIRSMGTHGMSGGLASAVYDTAWIFDACGFDVVIVETVGVGQDEVDVVKIADTTVVVVVPGLGDSIQTIKAGIMEIGDVLVVNKADKPGAEETVAELDSMLDLGGKRSEGTIPIVKTTAKDGGGIEDLAREIGAHRKRLEETTGGSELRRRRYEGALIELVKGRLMRMISDEFDARGKAHSIVDRIVKTEIDPHAAAEEMMREITKKAAAG